ncbi:hypothetical protein [Acidithiobacillus ferridurans]|nr:hypothetical protein [Acidithiobacillus ferridurans]
MSKKELAFARGWSLHTFARWLLTQKKFCVFNHCIEEMKNG